MFILWSLEQRILCLDLPNFQPRINPTLLLAHAEPKSVKQDLHDPKWLAAMKDEFDALERNHTWSLVPLSQHRSAIGCKWVFRIRENSDVSIKK